MNTLRVAIALTVLSLFLVSCSGGGGTSNLSAVNQQSSSPPTAVALPKVFWATQPVQPDETVLISAGDTDSTVMVEVAKVPDGDGSSPLDPPSSTLSWESRSTIQANERGLKFIIPATWNTGVYAYRIDKSGQTGTTQYLNRPDVWFVKGDAGSRATPGGWLQVHGVALALAGSARQPSLALVRNGVVVSVLSPTVADSFNNAYRQRFSVPVGLATGSYEVYLHNGHGGSSGWTRYSAFTTEAINAIDIITPAIWPQTVYTVATQTGSTDEARLQAAISAARTNGGGIIQLPTGTITLTAGLQLPNHVLLRGAGKNLTTLKWGDSYAASGPLIRGSDLVLTPLLIRARFSIEDLTVQAGTGYSGNCIDAHFLRNDEFSYLRRIRCDLPNQAAAPGLAGNTNFENGVSLRQMRNFEITDSEISARNGVLLIGNVQHLYVANNTIQWRHQAAWLSAGSWDHVFEGNRLIYRGPFSGSNAEYPKNDNPGFWHTMFGAGARHSKGVYYSNNKHELDHATVTPCLQAPNGGDFSLIPNAYPAGGVGWTSDGIDGIYFGGVASVTGTTVTLGGNTRDPGLDGNGVQKTYDWAGGILIVVSGKGAGQQRILTQALDRSNTVSIDHPLDVVPDSTSVVTVGDYLGQLLRVKNDFGYDCVNQDYFLQTEHVMADNSFPLSGWISWSGVHYSSYSIGQRMQMLGNRISSNRLMPFAGVFPTGYTGPGIAFQAFRNNQPLNTGDKPIITVRASAVTPTSDVVIEGNAVSEIQLGRTTSEPLNHQNILIRKNTGASYTGNLTGRNLSATPGLYFEP